MLFVRTLTATEETQLLNGLTADNLFTRRRCQILLASARGEKAKAIYTRLGCSHDVVRTAIQAFNRSGVASLQAQHRELHFIVDKSQTKTIQKILSTPPTTFGKTKQRWTLELLAEVCCEQGLAARVISREGMRQAIERMGIAWQYAKS